MRKMHFFRTASFAWVTLVVGMAPFSPSITFAAVLDPSVDQKMDQDMDDLLLLNSVRGADAVQASVDSLASSSSKPCSDMLANGATSDSTSSLASSDRAPFVGNGALFLGRGGHAYAIFGGGHASEGGSLQNRALELGFGTNLSSRFRVDVAHINEGHPINNHRDGFAAKAMYVMPLNEKARIEVGGGPYVSMNTTTPEGRTIEQQKDEKRLGAVGTAAFLYRMTQGGLYARVQLNHVTMPGAPTTNAVLVGLGRDFNGPLLSDDLEALESNKLQVAGWIGKTKTNRASAGGTLMGGQLEASKEVSPSMAYSVSLVDEGNGPKVNRKGVASQIWYVKPVEDNWKLKAGVGPYIAKNNVLDDHRVSSNAMISLVVERKISKDTSISGRFNRVMSTNNRDQDMFMLGLKREF